MQDREEHNGGGRAAVPGRGDGGHPPDFFERVAMRAHRSYPKAQYEARCVIEVADEATEGALSRQIRPALDSPSASVLFAGSSG
ncbi:hypothetical protein ACFYZJ_00005 [Streptomyces sp. NPDC001848]|uniref:hypothetical protein n=1 Tax=Streptomyces sp. NPDC001848 TaxID=3364618 RepID=UPI00369BD22B